jgi:hypothetical protein
VKGLDFIMIEDLDQGGRSLTNGIHDVVDAILYLEKLCPDEVNVIYKDSEGTWDGYIFQSNTIYSLNEKHWLKAAMKVVREYQQ